MTERICSCFGGSCFRQREQSIGASVNETRTDTAIDAVTVSENSRKILPMSPPINSNGMNAATRERLIDSTVNAISREPFNAAASGDRPSSTCR